MPATPSHQQLHFLPSQSTEGVQNLFLEVSSAPTGTCAVLVKDAERSLIAKLGAAESYDPAHFETDPVQTMLKDSEVFYMAGTFRLPLL